MSSKKLLPIVASVAIILLIAVLGVLGYTYWNTRPSNLYVSNVTDRSATVSWVSSSATPGVVVVKDGNFIMPFKVLASGVDKVGYDDRDRARAELEAAKKTQENLADTEDVTVEDIITDLIVENYGQYYVHHVTVSGLNPETEYSFMVGNGWFFHKEGVVGTDDKAFKTFAELDELATPSPAYGTVVESGDSDPMDPAKDAVLYMRVDFGNNKYSQLLSSPTAENGTWYIDLSNARDEFGSKLGEITDDLNEKVRVEGGPAGSVAEFDNPASADAPMSVLALEKEEVQSWVPFGSVAGEVNAVCCEAGECVDTNGNTVSSFGGDGNFQGGDCNARNRAACPAGSVAVGGGNCGGSNGNSGSGDSNSNGGNQGQTNSNACGAGSVPSCAGRNIGDVRVISSQPNNSCTCALDPGSTSACGCYYIPPQVPKTQPTQPTSPVANPGVNCGNSGQVPCEDLPQPVPQEEAIIVVKEKEKAVDSPLPDASPIMKVKLHVINTDKDSAPVTSWQSDTNQRGSAEHNLCLRGCNGNCNMIDIPLHSQKYATEAEASVALDADTKCKEGGNSEVYEMDSAWYYTCTQYFQWNCEPASSSSLPSIVSKVSAQTNPGNSDFLFDPSSEVYYVGESGVYQITYDGQVYEAVIGEGDQNVILYIDQNANGQFDEGTDVRVAENPVDLNISQTAEANTYRLQAGFNFVALPFIPTDYPMASDLLEYINSEYGNSAYSVAKFDGTWKVVGANGGNHNVNDFQLVPGVGYLIKMSQSVDVTITGRKVLYESEGDAAPIFFSPGWNLVSIYGSKAADYTAESWIEGINDYEVTDLTAVNVTRWQTDRARYDGLQKEKGEDGEYNVYGFDFPLNQYNSYFVRITEGQGNWQPEMKP